MINEEVKTNLKSMADNFLKFLEGLKCSTNPKSEKLKEKISKNYTTLNVAIESLEKAEKYKWHDLRKNPDDLPEDGHWVQWTDGKGNYSTERFKEDAINKFFPDGRWFELEDAIAWREIERFKEEE